MVGRVEALIPTWNGAERLRVTLRALQRQTLEPSVCVIDNGSTDGTRRLVDEEFPNVRYLRLDHNHGFGAALNRGVESGSADLVILLNDDTEADSHLVQRAIEAQELTGAEMVGLCLRRMDGSIDSLGVEIDRSLNAYDLAYGEPYRVEPPVAPPLGPTGGAAAYTRAAFLAVGGYDESIFAYLEDVELGIRMRMEGMKCALAYEGFAWHRHSSTLGARSAAKNRLLGRHRGYLLWKYGANLTRSERLRGYAGDAVVYLGKALVDRNFGAIRGRLDNARALHGLTPPGRDQRFMAVPRVELSVGESLRRRLSRRR